MSLIELVNQWEEVCLCPPWLVQYCGAKSGRSHSQHKYLSTRCSPRLNRFDLPRPRRLSPISSFTAIQAPCYLASSLADVIRFARLRLLMSQACSSTPVGPCRTYVVQVVLDASPVGPLLGPYVSSDYVAAYGSSRFPFVCFALSCFHYCLVALSFIFPSSLAMRLRVLPLFLTLRLLSCFDYHSFSAFNLNTERLSHTALRGQSPAGLSLSLFLLLSFPPSTGTYYLCIAQIVSTTRTRCINTRSTALPKGRQPWPHLSLHPFACISEQP